MPGAFRFEPCPTCCEIPCGCCSGGLSPAQYEVTLAGIVNGTCTDCASLDGTYILDKVYVSDSQCEWTYEFRDGAPCPKSYPDTTSFFRYVDLNILKSGSNYYWRLRLVGWFSDSQYIEWKTSNAALYPDCTTISGLDIPYNYQTGVPCSGSSATATLSAI